MSTPDYVISEEITCYNHKGDHFMLPKGAFVRPIKFVHLPREIRVSEQARYFNPETDVYAYTHFGILLISKKYIERIFAW